MNEGIFFKDIEIYKKNISDCDVIYKDNCDNVRLYYLEYNVNDSRHFYAKAVEFVSCSAEATDVWKDESLAVDVVFEVIKYNDGVRHLHFNQAENGYLYYPNVAALAEMLKIIAEK